MRPEQPDHSQGHDGVPLGSADIRHFINEPSYQIASLGVGRGPASPFLDIFDVDNCLFQVVRHVVTESAFELPL